MRRRINLILGLFTLHSIYMHIYILEKMYTLWIKASAKCKCKWSCLVFQFSGFFFCSASWARLEIHACLSRFCLSREALALMLNVSLSQSLNLVYQNHNVQIMLRPSWFIFWGEVSVWQTVPWVLELLVPDWITDKPIGSGTTDKRI